MCAWSESFFKMRERERREEGVRVGALVTLSKFSCFFFNKVAQVDEASSFL